MKRTTRIITTTIMGFTLAAAVNGAPIDSSETLSLEGAIEIVIRSNPALNVFNWEIKRADEKLKQAGSWMDPTLNFGMMNVPIESWAFDQEPMTGKQISLMQKIPFPGKLGVKADAASYEVMAAKEDRLELEGMLIRRVKEDYFNLYLADQSIRINTENIGLLKSFVEIAETRYSVGRGIQQDVLKAQVSLSKLEERLINLNFDRKKIVARLNTLMNRDPQTPLTISNTLSKTENILSESELMELVEESRPYLKALRYRIKSEEKITNYYRKLVLPDLSVEVIYTQRDELINGIIGKGADFLSVNVGFSLPIKPGNRQSSKVEESKASVRISEESYKNALNNVKRDIEINYSDIDKGNELLELYEDRLLPQARQSLNSALSGYQVDKVDFITLLDNQVTLFEYQISNYRILSNYEKSIARIEAVVGIKLN
ncbi:MAG: TolC family protein [Candidatus Marinimicrobia bacterium]|nr:TolC family protein [Candidatus Neomarinimicrobiota bacterium]